MADKKMNDFATATDGAYIYAESASGEQIKISKADLASVVAGLLGKRMPIINRRIDVSETLTINNTNGWGSILHIIDITGGNSSILIFDADEADKYMLIQTSGNERIGTRWNLQVTAQSLTMTNISNTGRYVTIREL